MNTLNFSYAQSSRHQAAKTDISLQFLINLPPTLAACMLFLDHAPD